MSTRTTDWDRGSSAPKYWAMHLKMLGRRGPKNCRQHSALPWADLRNQTCNPGELQSRKLKKENCEAILLIEATNAFNLLNRTTALKIFAESAFLPTFHLQTPNRHQAAIFWTKKPFYLAKAALKETH